MSPGAVVSLYAARICGMAVLIVEVTRGCRNEKLKPTVFQDDTGLSIFTYVSE